MLDNRPVGGKDAFDSRTQMVGVEMFYWHIAPSQRIGRIDLHPTEAFNKPSILPLRRFVLILFATANGHRSPPSMKPIDSNSADYLAVQAAVTRERPGIQRRAEKMLKQLRDLSDVQPKASDLRAYGYLDIGQRS